MQRRACTYQAQELEVDVGAMIRGTDPLGRLEAAGIVVDLFKDWSQFCKEFAIQFRCRAGQLPRSQSLRLDRRPADRFALSTAQRGRESPGCGAGRPNRDTGPPEWDAGD